MRNHYNRSHETFLSLCREHLSVDNMNKAIQMATDEMNASTPEFTVVGKPYGSFLHIIGMNRQRSCKCRNT